MQASVIHLGRMTLDPLDLYIIYSSYHTQPPSVIVEYHESLN